MSRREKMSRRVWKGRLLTARTETLICRLFADAGEIRVQRSISLCFTRVPRELIQLSQLLRVVHKTQIGIRTVNRQAGLMHPLTFHGRIFTVMTLKRHRDKRFPHRVPTEVTRWTLTMESTEIVETRSVVSTWIDDTFVDVILTHFTGVRGETSTFESVDLR
jgi:hypothetical protein